MSSNSEDKGTDTITKNIEEHAAEKKTKKQKKMSKDTQCTDPAPEADNITVYEHICSDSEVGSAHSTQKICRILGSEVDPIHDPFTRTYAPQPPHVKQYKMKKRFGEEVVVEHATVSSDEDETVESSSHSLSDTEANRERTRRVQKFFGEKIDLEQASYTARLRSQIVPLTRKSSREVQPAHVDVAKLNKFFGRKTEIHKRTESDERKIVARRLAGGESATDYPDDNPEADDTKLESERSDAGSESDDETRTDNEVDSKSKSDLDTVYERRTRAILLRKQARKLRNLFGAPIDLQKDKNAVQFAPQPAHVKQYKLNKHFGTPVAVERGDTNDEQSESLESGESGESEPSSHKLLKVSKFFGQRVKLSRETETCVSD